MVNLVKKVSILIFTSFCLFTTGCGNSQPSHYIVRLDNDGYLYYMNYSEDYYSKKVISSLDKISFMGGGCSSFFTHDMEGNPITCRNYDYPHRSIKDKSLTGLNVVLHCKPEGKYESIAMGDAIWCGDGSPYLEKGGPDLSGFDIHLLDTLPFQCSDGINEKGLTVSVLKVDIKEGEEGADMPNGSTILVRNLLDECANVKEAVNKIDNAMVTPQDWQDCHVFVTDIDNNSLIIESRNHVITTAQVELATNFYLTYDDIEDFYKDGKLREKAVKYVDKNGECKYHFGYGHGYHRFVTLASQLEQYYYADENISKMPKSIALTMLQSVAQNEYTTAAGVSMTQYTAIYSNNKKTIEVWPFQNYTRSWTFDITGKNS